MTITSCTRPPITRKLYLPFKCKGTTYYLRFKRVIEYRADPSPERCPDDKDGCLARPGWLQGFVELAQPMADAAQRMLSDFLGQMRSAHPGLKSLAAATTKLAKGLPAQTIVNEAEALGASLIAIGSRGKSSFAKLLYGSNAEKVTRLSPIPVTVVKAPSP